MKKKLGIILFTLGIILSSFGLILGLKHLNPETTSDTKSDNQTEQSKTSVENENQGIKTEKCLDALCISDMSISKQAGIYSISATLRNTSSESVLDKAINLIFKDAANNEIKTTYYIIAIPAYEAIPLEIQFTEENKKLMEVNTYEIENASTEEYNQVKNNITN